MTAGRAYYAGGARVVVAGVPIRLARKPSKDDLADLRAYETERAKPLQWGRTRADREQRAKEANDAIEIYAEMLEISVTQAKARIAAQRQHELANPPREMILEYDL